MIARENVLKHAEMAQERKKKQEQKCICWSGKPNQLVCMGDWGFEEEGGTEGLVGEGGGGGVKSKLRAWV